MNSLDRAVVALCCTQITSWGTLYYTLPVATEEINATTGWSASAITAAFSAGLLVAAGAGIWVGSLVDRLGPRRVMSAGSVVGTVALALVGIAPNLPMFFVAWAVAGVAQAGLLYPPAFAAITCWYGDRRTRPLTIVTLAGGFASTVFAPLTAVLIDAVGWRGAYLVCAGVVAVVTFPLHALFLTPPWHGGSSTPDAPDTPVRTVARSRRFVTLQAAMSLGSLGLYAAPFAIVPLFTDRGLSHTTAAFAIGLIGFGQVLGRIVFAALPAGRTPTPRTVGIVGAAAATLVLLAVAPGAATVLLGVAILIGMTRGAYTLLNATAVADRWPTGRFGTLNGVFVAPIQVAMAIAPATGALLAGQLGGHAAAIAVLAAVTAAAATLAAWS